MTPGSIFEDGAPDDREQVVREGGLRQIGPCLYELPPPSWASLMGGPPSLEGVVLGGRHYTINDDGSASPDSAVWSPRYLGATLRAFNRR